MIGGECVDCVVLGCGGDVFGLCGMEYWVGFDEMDGWGEFGFGYCVCGVGGECVVIGVEFDLGDIGVVGVVL